MLRFAGYASKDISISSSSLEELRSCGNFFLPLIVPSSVGKSDRPSLVRDGTVKLTLKFHPKTEGMLSCVILCMEDKGLKLAKSGEVFIT